MLFYISDPALRQRYSLPVLQVHVGGADRAYEFHIYKKRPVRQHKLRVFHKIVAHRRKPPVALKLLVVIHVINYFSVISFHAYKLCEQYLPQPQAAFYDYKFFLFLGKVLPCSLIQMILRMMYCPKKRPAAKTAPEE